MRKSVGMVIAGTLVLSGCNMVVSDEPWLSRSESAPKMKPGIWVDLDGEDCTFDVDEPVTEWPECADPALITADGRFFGYEKKDDAWNEIEVILDTAMPVVMQLKLPDELVAQAPEAPAYVYAAMRPVAMDAEGHVTEMTTWLLMCGPKAEPDLETAELESFVTQDPFPGLTMVGENCHANDLAALRGAAGASEALEGGEDIVRWVKEADIGIID